MAYTAPTTVVAGQTYSAAAHNVIVNDVIDHESRLSSAESLIAPFSSAWQAWTPNKTGSGWAATFTFSNSKYLQVGKMVMFTTTATFTGTGAGAGFEISLPVTAADAVTPSIGMQVMMLDVGTAWVIGRSTPNSTTYASVVSITANGAYGFTEGLTNTTPFTWSAANADKIYISGFYEAA